MRARMVKVTLDQFEFPAVEYDGDMVWYRPITSLSSHDLDMLRESWPVADGESRTMEAESAMFRWALERQVVRWTLGREDADGKKTVLPLPSEDPGILDELDEYTRYLLGYLVTRFEPGDEGLAWCFADDRAPHRVKVERDGEMKVVALPEVVAAEMRALAERAREDGGPAVSAEEAQQPDPKAAAKKKRAGA